MALTFDWKKSEAAQQYQGYLRETLSKLRNIHLKQLDQEESHTSIHDVLQYTIKYLRQQGNTPEADALNEVFEKVTQSHAFGGLALRDTDIPTHFQYEEVSLLTEAWLESVKSKESSRSYLTVNPERLPGSQPMTLAQKIFTQHALSPLPAAHASSLATNDVMRAGIDWVLASELAWSGMAQTHEQLGAPDIFRNDRFWLAGDHVVHPDVLTTPKVRAFVRAAERARRDFRMTDYQGMNYTIMHTEFTRERAEPGMLVLGSDSHTCSAGAVGCLAIGLGAADVMMALTLGETWFKVPESILIELRGEPAFGISGKDVILHILKDLKRNTVAAERIVEFAGEGARHLSVDARFAICNMCTEFGAITGVFVPDAVTYDYIQKRKRKANKSSSVYFQPDPDARYVESHVIDLTKVEPTLAVYPEPDNVVMISEKAGMSLDGVFIGACTTTEEELVLAALVLKAGLEKKLPLAKGKRHYVPGSLPITEKLKELGLLEVYEAAGFTRGPPGCSMCVGLSAEKALEGETWLSSQNRNFRHRMGPGSFGHITSAIVCAASAFDMKVTSPATLLPGIDKEFFQNYKGVVDLDDVVVRYAEPRPSAEDHLPSTSSRSPQSTTYHSDERSESEVTSKVVTLGDYIDTDALSPGFTLTDCKTDEDFGKHVLCYTHPDFRDKVSGGQRVVVAGRAFGVGSSRESAVQALKGAGVEVVIAKSFAFIYGRNQLSLGLLGIVMKDEEFYKFAEEGAQISIDLSKRTIRVGGKKFPFQLSEIEYNLTTNKGVTKAFKKYGKTIWEKLGEKSATDSSEVNNEASQRSDPRLEW